MTRNYNLKEEVYGRSSGFLIDLGGRGLHGEWTIHFTHTCYLLPSRDDLLTLTHRAFAVAINHLKDFNSQQ